MQPPLSRHQSPKEDGAQCDDAQISILHYRKTGGATNGGVESKDCWSPRERYGNLI